MGMIIRVAHAICAAEGKDGGHCCPTDFHCSDCVYMDTAIAAIQAMLEPTEAMMRAAQATNNQFTPDKWQAMIGAALQAERSEGGSPLTP